MPEHVVFQCANGIVLGLFSEMMFDGDRGPVGEGLRGFSLSVMVEDVESVMDAHSASAVRRHRRSRPRADRSGFGCGFSFCDRGNVWDVAHKYGSEFDHRGGFIYP